MKTKHTIRLMQRVYYVTEVMAESLKEAQELALAQANDDGDVYEVDSGAFEIDGPQGFTVWVCEAVDRGTHHVSHHSGTVSEAIEAAVWQTATDWGWDKDSDDQEYAPSNLHVLGVVAGDVNVVEWNDQ